MDVKPLIDREKCTGCGKCVEICPKDVLELKNLKSVVNSKRCMLCSHCYSVCSYDAIKFDEFLKDISFFNFSYESRVLNQESVRPGEIVNIFRSRKSIRKFRDTLIHDEMIRDLVEFAVTAPSGSNFQEWEFISINGRKKVQDLSELIKDYFIKLNRMAANPLVRFFSVFLSGKKLYNYYRDHYDSVKNAIELSEKGIDKLFHGAPSLLIIHGSKDGSTPLEDGCYASYNICLLAHYMGLGTCLIGFAVAAINNSLKLKEYLKIPDENKVHSVIALGEPDVEFCKNSLRKEYSLDFH